MKKQKISIIVPIYNSQDGLDKCIDSLINQTYKNLEIILVNDGSKDNSAEICKKYKKQDDRIIYLYQDNSGVSKARNNGMNISSGDYILFIDSDDYISKDYVEKLYNKMIKFDVKIGVTGLTEVSSSGKILKESIYLKEDKVLNINNFIDDFINYSYFTCVKMLFKRDILGDIRFEASLKFGEDMFFAYNLFRNNNVLYVANADYYYVQNCNSATHCYEIEKLEKYMDDNFVMMNRIKSDFPTKEYLFQNRLLSKLNIASSRYIKNEKHSKSKLKKFIKKYRNQISDINLRKVDYLGTVGIIKLYLLKFKFYNIYIYLSFLLQKIKGE